MNQIKLYNFCTYCKQPKPEDEFKMCEACRKVQYDRNILSKERAKKGELKRKPKKKPKPNSNLDKTLKKLRAYNEKHGTLLSYGKYTALVRAGKIKG